MKAKLVSITELLLSDKVILISTLLIIFITCLGYWVEMPMLGLFIPVSFAGAYVAISHLKYLYRFLFFLIPLSVELELPGGLAFDIPTEGLLIVLLGITILYILIKGIPAKIINKISFLLVAHITWILIASIFAVDTMVSFKYLLAKLWYILPFYVLPFFIIKDDIEIRILLKCFIAGLLLAAVYFFIQHYFHDLDYLSRTNAGKPIWRNHVNYACTLVISLPIIWYLWKTSRHPDKILYYLLVGIMLVFIYFAYARIAYICIAVSLLYVFILKYRLTSVAITLSIIAMVFSIFYLIDDNRFVHLAPEYEEAIMQLDFERKIEATTSGKDISTMERLYRWVAGSRMIEENPWTGFGPSNFYKSYRPYALYSFETYVSDNPEKSGIHNYYLMLLVEQGYIALLIFISLIITFFIKVQRLYFKLEDPGKRNLLLMAGSIMAMIITINAVNDMIEVIKIGGLFFFLLFVVEFIQKSQRRETCR